MNTADTLTNEELIEMIKEAKDRYDSSRNVYFDLDKELKRRLGYNEVLKGQTSLDKYYKGV